MTHQFDPRRRANSFYLTAHTCFPHHPLLNDVVLFQSLNQLHAKHLVFFLYTRYIQIKMVSRIEIEVHIEYEITKFSSKNHYVLHGDEWKFFFLFRKLTLVYRLLFRRYYKQLIYIACSDKINANCTKHAGLLL